MSNLFTNLYAKFKQRVPNPFYRRLLIGGLAIAAAAEGSVYVVMFQKWRRGEDPNVLKFDRLKWRQEEEEAKRKELGSA
ncbi:hypothetical protein HK097_007844, partial [Rhizophlyctis rosea]